MGITPEPYSDFAELKRRRDERLDQPPEPGPQPPPKFHLREQSLYGFAGEGVCKLATRTRPHPASIHLRFLESLGNAAGPGPLRATNNHVSLIARIIERELTGNLDPKARKPLPVAAQSPNFPT